MGLFCLFQREPEVGGKEYIPYIFITIHFIYTKKMFAIKIAYKRKLNIC